MVYRYIVKVSTPPPTPRPPPPPPSRQYRDARVYGHTTIRPCMIMSTPPLSFLPLSPYHPLTPSPTPPQSSSSLPPSFPIPGYTGYRLKKSEDVCMWRDRRHRCGGGVFPAGHRIDFAAFFIFVFRLFRRLYTVRHTRPTDQPYIHRDTISLST